VSCDNAVKVCKRKTTSSTEGLFSEVSLADAMGSSNSFKGHADGAGVLSGQKFRITSCRKEVPDIREQQLRGGRLIFGVNFKS